MNKNLFNHPLNLHSYSAHGYGVTMYLATFSFMDLHLALFMINFDNPIEFRTKVLFGCYAFVKSMNGFINFSIESFSQELEYTIKS